MPSPPGCTDARISATPETIRSTGRPLSVAIVHTVPTSRPLPSSPRQQTLTSLEICSGAGGQALGLEKAGFGHAAVVEIDPWAAATLRANRPEWTVVGPPEGSRKLADGQDGDVRVFDAKPYRGQIDLFAGGVPCPPFSKAGKQLGHEDERDLFPEALRLVAECNPRAVLLENVRGIMDPKFADYRAWVIAELAAMGYAASWEILQASSFGVSQLRPRALLVALDQDAAPHFEWPTPRKTPPRTVGQLLGGLMAERGWEGAGEWTAQADRIAPTLVGGSRKHGGPDLGPTRAKQAWAGLGVDGMGLANHAPDPGFAGMPKLTVPMAALVQGFPKTWRFSGPKTHAYRQVGNAFPPPVATAVGKQIAAALRAGALSTPLLSENRTDDLQAVAERFVRRAA